MHELRAGSTDEKLHVYILFRSSCVGRLVFASAHFYISIRKPERKIIKIYDVRRSHTAYGIPESTAVPFQSVNLNMQSSWRLTISNRIQSLGVNATCMI